VRERVEAALQGLWGKIAHHAGCASLIRPASENGPCDCDFDTRLRSQIARAATEAMRAYGNTELPSENIRALFGETQHWYVDGQEYATMEQAEAALVAKRLALKEAAGVAAFEAVCQEKPE
jgi:hypothetical protein